MELVYFLLGIIFSTIILPIVESFCGLLFAWVEAKKATYGEIVNESNIRMQKRAMEAEAPAIHPIGFTLTNSEEEEDYEDEEL